MARLSSRNAFDLHGCAVGENFGDALHYFRSVIAHRDDGISTVLGGMRQEKLVGIFTSLLAKIRQYRDIAADNGLQRGAQISYHAARPDNDSPHDAKILDDSVAGNFIGGGDHRTVHAIHSNSPGCMFTGGILPVHAILREINGSVTLGFAWRLCSITWPFSK